MDGGDATIRAKIFRFDPTIDTEPRYDTIEVPAQPRMRVLDVLEHALEQQGIGLGFRYFCGVKRCGLCAVDVNGKPSLACWEAATQDMVIGPVANMPVIRDLAVDRSAFERTTIALDPRLVRETPYAGFPEALTHVEMRRSYALMNCIECYVCSAACPAVTPPGEAPAGGARFAGPGTLVQLAKAALHPRDERDRAASLEDAGIEHCMSCHRCEQVCPVGIPIVSGAIEPLRAIALRGPRGTARFPLQFTENLRANVDIRSATLFVRARGILAALAALPMVVRMVVRGKTRVAFSPSRAARAAIGALFAAAGNPGRRP